MSAMWPAALLILLWTKWLRRQRLGGTAGWPRGCSFRLFAVPVAAFPALLTPCGRLERLMALGSDFALAFGLSAG